MEEHCKKSCNVCADEVAQSDLSPPSSDLEKNLIALGKKLKMGDAASLDPAAKKALEAKEPSPSETTKTKTDSSRPLITARSTQPVVVETVKQEQNILPVASPAHVSVIPSTKSKKELIVRCYRMTLKLAEVKECVAAAKLGAEYQHPSQNVLRPESDTVATHDSEDLSLTTRSSPSIDPAARKKLTQDVEALTTSEAKEGTAQGGSTNSDNLLVLPQKSKSLSLATWQALGVWILIIIIFLIVVRRVLKLRRRAKSGLRSE